MATASDQALNTIELLEHILSWLPLDAFLRARGVCASWREIITKSKRLQSIQSDPYIGVRLALPSEFSIESPPVLETDFILYYDKALTIFTKACQFGYASRTFVKFEQGHAQSQLQPLKPRYWGSKWYGRPHYFTPIRADHWHTLRPGVPFRVSWTYRRVNGPSSDPVHQRSVRDPVPGKMYALKVQPYLRVGNLLGTKENLLEKLERGEDLKSYVLDKPLMLVGENEVHYLAVP